ncbi:MAG: DegV family protein [Candidatus Paceibacterota bacterium]|jgi:DegV family protein with EDD domain
MELVKEKIGLIVGETSDLPQEIVDINKITVVRFKLDFQELANLPGNVYEKVREGEKRGIKSLIKTSQPSINDFLSVFKEKLKEFEEILCITFSSKISGAYNSAIQAKKFLEAELQNKVHVFDSMNASGSEGLVALKAISLIKQKLNLNEIIEKLKKELPNIKLIGMYKSPKWIEASGRFPRFVPAMMNQAERMDIKPVFGLRDGKLTIVGVKKNIKDIATALFEEFEKTTKKIRESGKNIDIAITHADNIEQANKLKDLILSLENTKIAFVSLICFPVGGHIGPGSMVLSWNQ